MAHSGKTAKVFIVEDNDPDVFLLEEALRSEGVQAELQRCHDGEEAVHALSAIDAAHVPDIIIIDLNLPKITGLEILKHTRTIRLLDRVPVVILTSSQSKYDRALAMQLGAAAYIAKPPTLPEFLSTVGSGVRSLLEREDRGAGAMLPRTPVCGRGRTSRRLRRFGSNQSRHSTRGIRIRP